MDARGERSRFDCSRRVQGEQDDADVRNVFEYVGSGLEPVHDGHLKVQDDEVRFKRLSFFYGLGAVFSLRRFPFGLSLQQSPGRQDHFPCALPSQGKHLS